MTVNAPDNQGILPVNRKDTQQEQEIYYSRRATGYHANNDATALPLSLFSSLDIHSGCVGKADFQGNSLRCTWFLPKKYSLMSNVYSIHEFRILEDHLRVGPWIPSLMDRSWTPILRK